MCALLHSVLHGSRQCRRPVAIVCLLLTAQPLFAAATLQVEYGDCATVLAGPVCIVPVNRTLTVWVRGADTGLQFHADDRMLRVGSSTRVAGGSRHHLLLPEDSAVLTVSAADAAPWQLALDEEALPAELATVRALLRDGATDEAIAQANRSIAAGAARRGTLLGILARQQLGADDSAGARATLANAIEANLADGRRLEALRDSNILAFLLMHKEGDFAAASRLYDTFDADPAAAAEAVFFSAYYRGLAALNAGDARKALRQLDAAAAQAQRMGWERRRLDAEQQLAEQLLQVGRGAEAYAMLLAWQARGLPELRACERANFLTNLGWTALFLEDRAVAGDPTPLLRDALSIYVARCSPNDRLNGGINLALAHLLNGHADDAQMALDEARTATDAPELRLQLWWLDAAAQVQLIDGDAAGALKRYTELQRLAAATLSPSARWRAATGRARALQKLGQGEQALAAWQEADRRLDEDLVRVPFDAGRATLVGARAAAIRAQLGLLLDLDHNEQALDLLRRSHARVVRSLQASAEATKPKQKETLRAYRELRTQLATAAGNSWSLSVSQLENLQAERASQQRALRALLDSARAATAKAPAATLTPVPAGHLLLAFHPLETGWVSLASDGNTVTAARPSCPEKESTALAACLLAPHQARISAANALHLLPAGALRQVDFHALTVGDGVLLQQASISYSLDLGTGKPQSKAAPRALLVADARGNLAHARLEVSTISEILGSSGLWSFEKLQGRAADSISVLRELEAVDLFHYAGHAEYAGERGWNSALGLAHDSTLDVVDVLSLQQAPRFVVLSGCETGRSADVAPAEAMGLANAFLASGSDAVLAAMRPVADEVAFQLMDRFYRAWTMARPAAEALRDAQLALRASSPDSDWAAFRLIERM